MSILGSMITALVAFSARPQSVEAFEAANAKLREELDALQETTNVLTERHAQERARADAVIEADARIRMRLLVTEDRLAVYEGRQAHPMSHLCCVPARQDFLARMRSLSERA